jgi:hypothetical protein
MMSKIKKAKRLRRPNIPVAVGPAAAGGAEAVAEPRLVRTEPAPVTFDYTHIKKDLTRIGVLAGSFIAILVVLSFVLPLVIK